MNKIHVLLVVIALSFLIGCSSSVTGTLVGFDKNPVPGALVRLIVIDDSGTELEEVGFAVTDSNGNFDVGYRESAGSSFVAEAVLPQGRIRGFACGNGSKVNLNPVSDALVRAVIYVTETEGGRTLTDFSKAELEEIIAYIEENDDDLWEMDLAGTEALVEAVIGVAGRLIPDAAGGSITVSDLASVEAPNTVIEDVTFDLEDPLIRTCPYENYRLTGQYYIFDVMGDGSLCNIRAVYSSLEDAYDGAYQLMINGDTFVDTGTGNFPGTGVPDPDMTYIEDDRELAFGPYLTDNGLSVTRKVYVPEGSDYARYLEVFENTTGSDRTLDIQIVGDLGLGVLGFDGIETLVDTDGDLVIGADDSYAVSASTISSEAVPIVGYLWDGFLAGDRADTVDFPPLNDVSFFYSWDDVTIPAGEIKVFMHYAYVSSSRVTAEWETALEAQYNDPDEEGLSSAELNALQNFGVTRGNVSGEAGSTISFENLTVENQTKALSLPIESRRDGSFNVNIEADEGDVINISGTSGTDGTLTVP